MKKKYKAGAMIEKMNMKKMKKGSKKNWIKGAIKHPGALHRQLGIKAGNKIPASTLKRAAGKGGKLGSRARLAETLKGMKHKKGSMKKKTAGFSSNTDSSTAMMKKKNKMKMCAKCGKKHMAGKHMKKAKKKDK